MNNRRNITYQFIIFSLFMMLILFANTLHFFLYNIDSILHATEFQYRMIAMGSLWAILAIVSLFALVNVQKKYKAQHEKYNHKIILENSKREKSALLMVIFFSIFIFPMFVVINAYIKSGLSKKQYLHAIHQIQVKSVDKILKQKAIINAMKDKKNNETKKLIDNGIRLREGKWDTKYNCNFFILKQIEKLNVKFNIEHDEEEIYKIGFNFTS